MENSIKILLLEDNRNDAELIRYQISKNIIKYQFKHVSKFDDFSKAIDEYIPDIILSDYNLLGFTGMDALELVKKKCVQTPFIIVTGTIDEETAAETIKKGAWDYIVKERLIRLDSAMKKALELKDEKEKRAIDREKLKISEERFRKLINNMPSGVAIYKALDNANDFEFIDINKKAEEITNTSKKEIIGHSLLETFPNMKNGPFVNGLTEVSKYGINICLPPFFYKDDQRQGWRENTIYKLATGEIVAIFKDVTDIKEAEEQLKKQNIELLEAKEKAEESNERFNLAMAAAKDGVYDWNLVTNEIYYSPGWKNILGYKDNELPNDLSIWQKLTNPADAELSWKMQQELINKQRDRFKIEFKMKHKDGHWVDILSRAEAVFDENDKAIRMVGTHVDITERKKAEEKIRTTEENLQNTFDLSPSIIAKANLDTGYFVEANQAATRILGYSVEEFTSRPFMEFIHPDDRSQSVDESSDQLQGKEVSFFENRYLCKDGSYKWMAWYGTKADESGIVNAIGSDVSERKQSERALSKSNEFNTRLLQTIPFGMDIVDEKGNILFMNEKFEKLFGSKTFGKKCWDIYRDSKQKCPNCPLHTGIQIGETSSYESTDIMGGKTFLINHTGILFHGKNAMLEIFQDITEKKLSEIELITAKEKAEESDRLKSAFLANMSHEIRTPMNGILGFAGLLKTPDLTGEKQQEYINIIEKGGARMLNIINDIVSISMIESGQMKVSIQESNINEQIEYIYNFFKLEVEEKGMQLSLCNSLSLSNAIINTDREKVFAVLTNLVKNAIKYTDKGSIELGYIKKGNFLEFYVKDTGIGVPKDRQKAIFERFIQADIVDTMARQGAGLGLSISKAYVEILGGKIWVESEEDNSSTGSTFYFTLPYQTENIKESITETSISNTVEVGSIKKLKILIVEDDEVSEELISIIVQDFAEEIIIARTGKEAVEASHKNPDIDLILMDIQLPEMDGYEASRQIRKSNKDVIIIAQTAFALVGDKKKVIEAGCDDYISKPINKEELLEIIVKHF